MKHLRILLFSLILGFLLLTPLPVEAADMRSGEDITLTSSDRLQNAYVFGENVISDSSIIGDFVTAGSNLRLRGSTTGSLNAAGGTLDIKTRVGNSIRAAGGDITISGPVNQDVVVAGGTLMIEKDASIGGDLIFTGGTLIVEGPVKGKIIVNGGSAIILGKVGGNLEGEVGTLHLKNNAEIGGDLNYSSSQKALIDDSAIVHGQNIYRATPEKKDNNGLAKFLAIGTLIKLVTDILFALLLIYLFPGVIERVHKITRTTKMKSGLLGLGFLIFTPIVAIFLLIIIWLGISVWLIYFLFLILALMLGKINLGYFMLSWWAKRNKNTYKLDWKAGIVGPVALAFLILIPIIGWLALAFIYLLTLGALLTTSLDLRSVNVKK